MSLVAWYAFPVGALVLGAVAFGLARWDQRRFHRLYPDERETKVAIDARREHKV